MKQMPLLRYLDLRMRDYYILQTRYVHDSVVWCDWLLEIVAGPLTLVTWVWEYLHKPFYKPRTFPIPEIQEKS